MRRSVWTRILKNEEAIARDGMQRLWRGGGGGIVFFPIFLAQLFFFFLNYIF